MSALLGANPTDEDLRGVCQWVLEDGVVYLCPKGLKAFATGAQRLLDERTEAEAWLREHFDDDEDEYSFADCLKRLFAFADQGFGEAGRLLDENKRLKDQAERHLETIAALRQGR